MACSQAQRGLLRLFASSGTLARRNVLAASEVLIAQPLQTQLQAAPPCAAWRALPHGARGFLAGFTSPGETSPGPDAAKETRSAWRPGQGPASASGAGADSGAEEAGPSSSTEGPQELEEVFAKLEGMGLQPGRNCVVGDGLAVVDVGLYLDGVKVALEMEEQRPGSAVSTNAAQFAIKSTRRRVLQAHGWHLVTLASSDWRRLDADQKEPYLAHCINHALGSHGGGGAGSQGHQHGSGCGSGCGHSHH